MKKTITYIALFAALISGVSFTSSCNKENVAAEPTVQIIHVELGAQLDDATKATYATGTKLISLESGDKLSVELTHDSGWTTATGTLTSDGTTFSGELTVTGTYSGTDIFVDATSVTATLLPGGAEPSAFAAGAKETVIPKVAGVKGSTYDAGTKTITLAATNAIMFYTVGNLTASTTYDVYATDGATGIFGSVTTGAAETSATFAVGYTPGTHTYVCNVSGKTPIINTPGSATTVKVYNITRNSLADLPAGAVPGVFTATSGGKKVYFSKGYLMAQIDGDAKESDVYAAKSWKFAEHQYDRPNNSSGADIDYSGDKWVSWFSWVGASATNSNAQASYGLMKKSSIVTDYHGGTTSETLKADWGKNAITNGGNIADTWYTLQGNTGSDGWKHLFDNETSKRTVSYAYYAYAIVNGNNGLILFPDTFAWTSEMGTEPGTQNAAQASWNTTNYTTAQFEKMELAGCVFLPAGGRAVSGKVYDPGNYGIYWSTTGHKDNASKAYALYFKSDAGIDYAYTGDYSARYRGAMVRLVRNVNF